MALAHRRRVATTVPLLAIAVAGAFVLNSPTSAAPPENACTLTLARGPDAPSRLVVWHVMGFAPEEMLVELTAEFESANPGLDVELVNLQAQGGVLQGLRADLPEPDVVLINQEANINLSDSGRATPVEACAVADDDFDAADLMPAAIAANSVDDTLWSLPVMVSTPLTYFDKTQFRAAGVDPDSPPADLDQLEAVLRTMLESGQVKAGLVTASPEWFISAWAADLGIEFADESGRNALGPSEFNLEQKPLVDRLEHLRDMAEAGLVASVDGRDFQDLLLLTDPTAPAAMVAHSSGSMKTVYDTLESAFPYAELGVFPFPTVTAGTTLGGQNAWMIARTAEQQSLSWRYMKFLSGTEAQARIGTLGYAPARLSSLDDPALVQEWTERPGLRVASDVLWAIEPGPGNVGWAAGPESTVTWRLAWSARDILAGRPAADALKDAETDVDSTLIAYRRARGQTAAP